VAKRKTAHERAILSRARREDINGWIHLRIGGEPRDRGFQHGYLLAPEIREALRSIRYLIFQGTGVKFDWFARNAQAMYEDMLRSDWGGKLKDGSGAEMLEELEGIVAGANKNRGPRDREVTLTEIIGWNAYPELICQWWPAVLGGSIKPAVPLPKKPSEARALHSLSLFGHSCSSFVATGAWTADGGIVSVQTTWQCFANGDAYNVILDVAPERGHRILMQSVPGYIFSSTDFWVTGAGLVVAETSFNGVGFDTAGLPEFFRSRRAGQYANSIRDWRDLFRVGNNGGYTNSWLLSDANTGEIGCCELTLRHDVLKTKKSGYFAGFNIPLDVRVRNLDCGGASGWDNVLMSGSRRVRFDQLLAEHKGEIDLERAQHILSDHRDVYLNAEFPSSRTICGHIDNDDGRFGGHGPAPWYPWGSLDGKATTSSMAREMRMSARWGRACGTPFVVDRFLDEHPQYDWLRGYMKDRPRQPWTEFAASS
jgi:hypothetical protein